MATRATLSIKVFIFCLLFITQFSVRATHLLGAQITCSKKSVTSQAITINLTVLSDEVRTNSANDNATIYFGDGASESVRYQTRTTSNGISYTNYVVDHTYPAAGAYIISYKEVNRTIGVVNMTNSEQQSFAVSSQITIDPLITNNTSIQFLTNPVYYVPTGVTTTHQVGAYELEGDSLAYQLITPMRELNQNVQGYSKPTFIALNEQTGQLTWSNPEVAGTYSFAVKVLEYQGKRLIGSVIRDFVVQVRTMSTFNQTLAITNRTALGISPQNKLFIAPGQSITIKGLLTDADYDSLAIKSDIFHKGTKLTYTKTNSTAGVAADLTFAPDIALKRNAPYSIILRAYSSKGTDIMVQELGLQVFVGSRTTVITGIKKNSELEMLPVYPNPAREFAIIQHPNLKNKGQLMVYDATGRLVWQQATGMAATHLNRNNFTNSGKYVYQIASDFGIIQRGQFIFE